MMNIGRFLLWAVLASGGVFILYAVSGVHDVLSWRFGLRNILISILSLFLVESGSGRSLKDPLWRVPLFLFYLYALTIPVILSVSSDLSNVQVEATNSYFQMGLGMGIFTFLLSCAGQRFSRIRRFSLAVAMLIIAVASANLLVYVAYYAIFGAAFTVADMVTILLTNPQEVAEFLSSHIGWGRISAIFVIFVVYLALFGVTLWRIMDGESNHGGDISLWRKALLVLVAIAAVLLVKHWLWKSFPLYEYSKAGGYVRTLYRLSDTHEKNLTAFFLNAPGQTLAHTLPGTVIVVIGESANRDHMKAFNETYPFETTPWMSEQKGREGFYFYRNAYSNYPLTSEALSMFLTDRNQYNDVTLENIVTITDVANQAGYDTAWISNQVPSGGVLPLLASASAEELWIKPAMSSDKQVIRYLEQLPAGGSHFVVIHLAGSHDRYSARYPADYQEITGNDDEKVNEYDTSILYTDEVLRDIFTYARDHMNLQAMIYCSDHGEDMTYFHGGSQFTFDMVRVPLFIYLSPAYRAAYPQAAANLVEHQDRIFTNDLMYDTVSGIIQAPNSGYDKKYDLSSAAYGLTTDEAVTKDGQISIADDTALS